MTREEIIRLAREAGFETKRGMVWVDQVELTRSMQRFAALIEQRAAVAEREACAKRCERVADDYIAANGRHAAAIAYECAVAIRATGEKP